MKKILILLLVAVFSVGMLAGCGEKMVDPPAEEQIVKNVNDFGVGVLEEDGVVVTECEIIKRQTNEDDKEDIVYCRLISEEGYYKREYQFKLIYNYYDEGGWILDDVVHEKPEEWTEIYYDNEGNNIFDSIIWLDEYEDAKEECFPAEYFGEVNGIHYIGTRPYIGYTAVGDHQGKGLSGLIEDVNGVCAIKDVLIVKNGEIRLSMIDEEDRNRVYLANKDGNRLSDSYDDFLGPYGDEKVIVGRIYLDTGETLNGVLDENGNLLTEIKYTNRNDALAAVGITPPKSNKVPDNEKVVIRFEDYELDGQYKQRYFREDGTKVELPVCEDTDIDRSQGLIVCKNDDRIRFYDQNGFPRSPEFTFIQRSTESYSLISYEGRRGILPEYCLLGEKAGQTVEFEYIH